MTTDHGGGDTARTLALLWGTGERPSRGPKPGLTVDRIVRAAIEIADADGLAALSMRSVADRLGVGTMSLYRYVRGKGELLDLMLDAVLADAPLADSAPGGWRQKMEWYSRESWRLSHRHSWAVYAPWTRGLMGPNQTAVLDSALRALSGTGLRAAEMLAVYTLIAGYVRDAARTAVEAAELEKSTGVTDEQWWSEQGPLLESAIDASRFPTFTKVWADAYAESGENLDGLGDYFEFGLQRVLDGVEALVAARAAEAPEPDPD